MWLAKAKQFKFTLSAVFIIIIKIVKQNCSWGFQNKK